MSVMRLFSLVFALVASLVHSEEVQRSCRECEKLAHTSSVKQETNGKEVTEGVGAVFNGQVPHDPKEGEDEDTEEVGVVFAEVPGPGYKSTEDEDEQEKEEAVQHHQRRRR